MASVIKLFVQVCLPKIVGQNGMIYEVPAKCDQITCSSMFAYVRILNGIIHLVPAKCDQIICTSKSA
jgi:hypothetical protein